MKFALKVLLALTFPLWVVPAVIAGSVAVIGWLVWLLVSDLVDAPERRHGFGNDPGP